MVQGDEDEARELRAYSIQLDSMLQQTITRAELNLLSYLIAMAAEVAGEEAVRRSARKAERVG